MAAAGGLRAGFDAADPAAAASERLRRDARRERFEAEAEERARKRSRLLRPVAVAAPALGDPVVGVSAELFRPFVRLRGAADPAVVRPEEVLRRSLRALLRPSAQPTGGWEAVREQLWSIRQDLLVQHLHTGSLAAEVNLEGARLAIAAGDVAEVHRCLAPLVAGGACAARVRDPRRWPDAARDEVAALRLLYLTHGGLEGKPGRLEGELLEFLQEHGARGGGEAEGPALRYAQQAHAARASGNWLRQLRLCPLRGETTAERSTGALVRVLAPPVRRGALASLARAFPQGLAAGRAARLLGLDGGGAALAEWLSEELRADGARVRAAFLPEGRLACGAVEQRLEELANAATAAARDRADNGPSLRSGHTLMPCLPQRREGEDAGLAAIWGELGQSPATFAAGHAEILRRMAERKDSKKDDKKQLKKVQKELKKKLKKQKKKIKKAKKKDKKEMKKLEKKKAKEESSKQEPVVLASSSSSSSGASIDSSDPSGAP